MIRVYHALKPSFGFGPRLSFPEEFKHVADVAIPDEEYPQAFELTNSIHCPWWENSLVSPILENFQEHDGVRGERSTSVGDVIVLSDGRAMRCAMVGWESIS